MTLEDLESAGVKNIEIMDNSSQKKNILYYSFKNIRERYQFREQRANKIQLKNEKIIKEIQLPKINDKTKKYK